MRAMNNLGLMLERGTEGIPADPERASNLFKEDHKLGDADASVNLAMFYLNVSTLLFSHFVPLLTYCLNWFRSKIPQRIQHRSPKHFSK